MKTVLITGASMGIGKEFAKEFAKKKYNLLLVARSKDKLQQLAKQISEEYDVDAKYFVCDLSKKPKKVYDHCKENNIQIDVLVNNAGFGDYGDFIDSDINKNLEIIDVNNKALVELTYYFIQDMKDNGYGHIINTGSVASFVPGPHMAVYYASKAFVLSFSMALREELKEYNIKVSTLCPAPTKSDFWTRANGKTSDAYNNVFARTVNDAAKTGIKLFEKNKAYSIDGLPYKVLIEMARIMPLELCAKTIGYIQRKTKGASNE